MKHPLVINSNGKVLTQDQADSWPVHSIGSFPTPQISFNGDAFRRKVLPVIKGLKP